MQEIEIHEIKYGQGVEVFKGALVFINFVGQLENGRIFDSTEIHGRPFECVVGSKKIIQGMSLGLLGMKAGGIRKIKIPSHLAYGDRAIGGKIPAHSNLIFEVELLEARNRES